MTKKEVAVLKVEALDERTPYANILVYGETGTGKTVFASTAPRPILWLESEGGTSSIGDKAGIDIARVAGLDTYREALVYLEKNDAKYKTVVIDSFTETLAAVLKEIMRAVKTLDPTRDEFAPYFEEWQRLTGVMREIARAFRDLPMHVVITALEREDKDDLTGRSKVRPRMTPALADELPGFMDAVVYLYAATEQKGEVDEGGVAESEEGLTVVRNGLIKPTGKYVAKARIPEGDPTPDFIADPTFNKVAELLGIPTQSPN